MLSSLLSVQHDDKLVLVDECESSHGISGPQRALETQSSTFNRLNSLYVDKLFWNQRKETLKHLLHIEHLFVN